MQASLSSIHRKGELSGSDREIQFQIKNKQIRKDQFKEKMKENSVMEHEQLRDNPEQNNFTWKERALENQ